MWHFNLNFDIKKVPLRVKCTDHSTVCHPANWPVPRSCWYCVTLNPLQTLLESEVPDQIWRPTGFYLHSSSAAVWPKTSTTHSRAGQLNAQLELRRSGYCSSRQASCLIDARIRGAWPNICFGFFVPLIFVNTVLSRNPLEHKRSKSFSSSDGDLWSPAKLSVQFPLDWVNLLENQYISSTLYSTTTRARFELDTLNG